MNDVIVMTGNLVVKTFAGNQTGCIHSCWSKEGMQGTIKNIQIKCALHTHTHTPPNGVSQLDKHPVWRPPSATGETVTTEQTHLDSLWQIKHGSDSPANTLTHFSLVRVKLCPIATRLFWLMPTQSVSCVTAWMRSDWLPHSCRCNEPSTATHD